MRRHLSSNKKSVSIIDEYQPLPEIHNISIFPEKDSDPIIISKLNGIIEHANKYHEELKVERRPKFMDTYTKLFKQIRAKQ